MFRCALIALALMVSVQTTFAADLKVAHEYLENKQYDSAFNEFKPLAEKGIAEAQNELGLLCLNGNGVEKNENTAFSWFEKSAKKGDAEAQNNLALCYYDGIGTKQNYKQAIKWYTEAANKGHVNSQIQLGYTYVTGEGAIQDYSKALKWFKKAADTGSSKGQYNLGLMYLNGYGVTKNKQMAVEIFEKAAVQGNDDAKKQLVILNRAEKEFSDSDACHIIARAEVCGFNSKDADTLFRKNRNENLREYYAKIGAYQACYKINIDAANYELQTKQAKFTCVEVKKDLQKLTAFLRK